MFFEIHCFYDITGERRSKNSITPSCNLYIALWVIYSKSKVFTTWFFARRLVRSDSLYNFTSSTSVISNEIRSSSSSASLTVPCCAFWIDLTFFKRTRLLLYNLSKSSRVIAEFLSLLVMGGKDFDSRLLLAAIYF